jgi:inositol phosphorylceramide mannosyltransferase catalytic subunit
MIPQRIIQIWGGGRELPLLARCAATSIRLLNPGYEYLLFDDDRMERFVADKFPQYGDVFQSFRYPIQRYDFFRYLAVYELGGFYFDTDVFLASSLDELVAERCVFPFEALTASVFLRRQVGMDWEVGNYAFGAAAGHPFIHAIIENCVRAQQNADWVEAMLKPVPRLFRDDYFVLCATGPWLVSRTLAEFAGTGEEVKILFPEDVQSRSTWARFGTLGVHMMSVGWHESRWTLRRRLAMAWQSWVMKRLLRESSQLGKTRSVKGLGRQFLQLAQAQEPCQ